MFLTVALVVLFWANSTSHMSDNDIHLSIEARAKLIILLDDFEELVGRVEKKDGRVNLRVDELGAELKAEQKKLNDLYMLIIKQLIKDK